MQRVWHGFTLVMQWNSEREHELQVSGKVLPGCSAKTSGPPENCYPAEDDELDAVSVKVVRKGKTRKLSDDATFNLMEDPAFRSKLALEIDRLEILVAEEYD